VRTGFLQLAATDPGRWVVVAGTDDHDTVATNIRKVVRDRLGL
jgi:thymidylate kinase